MLKSFLISMIAKELFNNVRGTLGAHETQCWMAALPHIIASLAQKWSLTNIVPIEGMTWHYVVKALQGDDQLPVVLKIAPRAGDIQSEIRALNFFGGEGCVPLIDMCQAYGAFLVPQLLPGIPLTHAMGEKVCANAYASVVQGLIKSQRNKNGIETFPHVRSWLQAIDRQENTLPDDIFKQAISLKEKRLSGLEIETLCHGDLHLGNILSQKNHWTAIDPKGVVGNIYFETACFDFIEDLEQPTKKGAPILFVQRIQYLADRLTLNPAILREWVFVRLVLGASWMIEDGGNPENFLHKAKIIVPYL